MLPSPKLGMTMIRDHDRGRPVSTALAALGACDPPPRDSCATPVALPASGAKPRAAHGPR